MRLIVCARRLRVVRHSVLTWNARLFVVIAAVALSTGAQAHDFELVDEIDRMDDKRRLSLVGEDHGVELEFRATRQLGFVQKICIVSTDDADKVVWFEDDLRGRYRLDSEKPKNLILIPQALTWARTYNCKLWKAITKRPDSKRLLLELETVGSRVVILEFDIEGLAADINSILTKCKADKGC